MFSEQLFGGGGGGGGDVVETPTSTYATPGVGLSFVQVNVNLVAELIGPTTSDAIVPLGPDQPPDATQSHAFVVVHESVVLPPAFTGFGVAQIDTCGTGHTASIDPPEGHRACGGGTTGAAAVVDAAPDPGKKTVAVTKTRARSAEAIAARIVRFMFPPMGSKER
jgi:hypothetical protein